MSLLLDKIDSPDDLRDLSAEELEQLAQEIREELVNTIQGIGGRRGTSPRISVWWS